MTALLQSADFWLLIAFVVFLGLFGRKAYQRIVGMLDERSDKIRAELDRARELREEAQSLLAEYQRKQRDAVQEAEAMMRAAEEESARMRDKAAADLDTALKRREQQALDRIAQAEAQARADVRNIAVDLAVTATRKILTEQLDDAKAAELIDAAIKEIPAKLH